MDVKFLALFLFAWLVYTGVNINVLVRAGCAGCNDQ